ncbi:Late embryogenesis abundant protein [Quillaja saponaria]|uniref:Late embryogenesis abundant protein n=1 Tax=Quillaja saponaria TaxID=32244 RepID=A0AAD7LUI8_QUISA|nr:Late embryogenesis abundant protein [Quillaja saponaria]
MSKPLINNILLLCLSRRSYTVAADNVTLKSVTVVGEAKTSRREKMVEKEQKEIFWMRDPKTGNWIPENQFEEVDVAELRNKFVFKKKQ